MSRIQQQVMASVLVIYFARKAIRPRALKLYALIAAGGSVAALVSVPDVLANVMTVGVQGFATFLYAAVANTTPMVQVSTAVAVIMAALLVRDIAVSSRSFA